MLKFPFVLGVGVGFVLGARAGRERYEQIVGLAKRTKDNPTVASAAGAVAHRGPEVIKHAAEKAAEKAPDWVPGSRSADADSDNGSSGKASASNGSARVSGSAEAVTEADVADMPTAAPGHI